MPRGVVADFDPWVSEWGNPVGVIFYNPYLNKIGYEEASRGTETSQYPEENKTNQ